MNEAIKILRANNIPPNLKNIPNPPSAIYYRGSLNNLLNNNNVAIVGTRKNTDYGFKTAKEISKQLALHNICIVSGLALGIDSIAIESAIENGGKVIAVLASGLNNECIGPRQNFNLAMKIIESGGTLVSEYSAQTKAQRHHFPIRNRIISALSMATIVIEADFKSGSLITAKHALIQNKDVFSVPGSIFSSQSNGTNFLITQGAIPVTTPKEILYYYGIKNPFDESLST